MTRTHQNKPPEKFAILARLGTAHQLKICQQCPDDTRSTSKPKVRKNVTSNRKNTISIEQCQVDSHPVMTLKSVEELLAEAQNIANGGNVYKEVIEEPAAPCNEPKTEEQLDAKRDLSKIELPVEDQNSKLIASEPFTSKKLVIENGWKPNKALNIVQKKRKWGKLHYIYQNVDPSLKGRNSNSKLFSITRKAVIGYQPTPIKITDTEDGYYSNAKALEAKFKDIFISATHDDMLELKASKYEKPKADKKLSKCNLIRAKSYEHLLPLKAENKIRRRHNSTPNISNYNQITLYDVRSAQEKQFDVTSNYDGVERPLKTMSITEIDQLLFVIQNSLTNAHDVGRIIQHAVAMQSMKYFKHSERVLNALKVKSGWMAVIEFNLAMCKFAQKNYTDALTISEELILEDEHNWRYLRLCAQCLLNLERFDEALEKISVSYYLHPIPSTLLIKANICSGLNDFESASDCCTIASEMDPTDNEILMYHGIISMKLKRWRKAIDSFSIILSCKVKQADARFQRGKCWFQLGELKKSLVDLSFVESYNNEAVLLISRILLKTEPDVVLRLLKRTKICNDEFKHELLVLKSLLKYMKSRDYQDLKGRKLPEPLFLYLLQITPNPMRVIELTTVFIQQSSNERLVELAKYYQCRALVKLGNFSKTECLSEAKIPERTTEIKAIKLLASLRKKHPVEDSKVSEVIQNSRCVRFKVAIMKKLKNYADALEVLNNQPENVDFLLEKVSVLLEMKKPKKAAALIETLESLEFKAGMEPELIAQKARYYYLLGILYKEIESYEESLDCLKKSFQFKKSIETRIEIGTVHSLAGSYAKTEPVAIRRVKSKRGLRVLCYHFMRNNLFSKTIHTCNEIIKKYGPDPLSLLLRGIAKCQIQAVGLGRLDLDRANSMLKDDNGPDEWALILYNQALVNKYEESGFLEQSSKMVQSSSVLKVNIFTTMALITIQKEKWALASASLEKLATVDGLPTNLKSRVLHSLGIASFRAAQNSDQQSSVMRKCARMFEQVVDQSQASLSCGIAYLFCGNFERAEQQFKKAASTSLSLLNLAILELKRNCVGKCYSLVQQYIQAVDQDDTKEMGYLFLAKIYMLRGQELLATKALDNIKSPLFTGNKNFILGVLAKHDSKKSFEYFETGAKLGDGFCSYAGATMLMKTRQYKLAAEMLKTAFPTSSALTGRAVLAALGSDYIESEKLLSAGLERCNDHQLIYINLAIIKKEQQKYTDSFDMISRAIKLYPNDEYARYFRYYLSSDAENDKYKEEDIRYIINISPI